MTDHYFENDLVKLHYYQFGNGPQTMLCFHGYGMHGKQFKVLETTLGSKYTFYGFDLFFHKQTKLHDQSLPTVKKGITKTEVAELVLDFCRYKSIDRFSVIGYSMGTHYAATVVEELGDRIDEFIVAAPMFLKPGALITYFSKTKTGNKILEKLALNEKTLVGLLKLFKRLRFINSEAYKILYGEIGTSELRFNFYACFIYLRFLEIDQHQLLTILKHQNIKTIFIFGKRDKAFPPRIGEKFIAQLPQSETIILDTGHEMIKHNFVSALTDLLL